MTARHCVVEAVHAHFPFSPPFFPFPFCLSLRFPNLALTGILQKETKFPRMVCRLSRDLHGLVTDLKRTKTTKTLIAGGQPVTTRGLDCEAHCHLSRTTLSTSFDLLASTSPKVLKFLLNSSFSLISYLFAFDLCLFGSSLPQSSILNFCLFVVSFLL